MKLTRRSAALVSLGLLAAFLSACAPASPAVPSPTPPSAATVTEVPATAAPTVVPVPPTPAGPPVISADNFPRLTTEHQWQLASDVVKPIGAVLSPHGDMVALLTLRYPELYSLELHAAASGQLLWKHDLPTKAAYPALAFSPDAQLLAVGLGSGDVILWNTADGSSSQTLKSRAYAVRAVAFSPDGKLLAASGSDSMVHLWDMPGGTERSPYVLKRNVGSLAFSPDTKYLAAVSTVFAVFDLSSQASSPVYYYDALAPHPTGEILFSSDGQNLVAVAELNDRNHNTWIPRILIWTVGSPRQAVRKIPLDAALQDITLLPDGQTLLGYDSDNGQLEAIDAPSKSVIGSLPVGNALFVEYCTDLNRFMTVTKNTVLIWSTAN